VNIQLSSRVITLSRDGVAISKEEFFLEIATAGYAGLATTKSDCHAPFGRSQ